MICAHCHNPIGITEDAFKVGESVYCEQCIEDIYEDMRHGWDGPVADVVHRFLRSNPVEDEEEWRE